MSMTCDHDGSVFSHTVIIQPVNPSKRISANGVASCSVVYMPNNACNNLVGLRYVIRRRKRRMNAGRNMNR